MDRVIIQWTDTADSTLARLPKPARRGLLDKVNQLSDAIVEHKQLAGPLEEYHYVCFSRYRAPYQIQQESLPSGDTLTTIRILFVATGDHDEARQEDIYRFAQHLLSKIEPPGDDTDEE